MKKRMSYKIIAKYIKHLNFDISLLKVFPLTKDISNYKFKIDIKSNRFRDNIIEIKLHFHWNQKITILIKLMHSLLIQLWLNWTKI